jgi:hypothetical protein
MTPREQGQADLRTLFQLQSWDHSSFLRCVPLKVLEHPDYRAMVERRHGLMFYLINGEINRRWAGGRKHKRFQQRLVPGTVEMSYKMCVVDDGGPRW